MAKKFTKDFKHFFIRGLAAVLPAMLTVMILLWAVGFVYNYLGRYIHFGVQWIVVQAQSLVTGNLSLRGTDEFWVSVKNIWQDYHRSFIGFVLAFVAIYMFGRFLASFVGRSLWIVAERTIFRAPVVKQIYPSIKQVTDFLLAQRQLEFSGVVSVEYPRKGIWSLGLVTGPGMRTLTEGLGSELLTVFIPSSPTPVTGYTITVRRDEVIDLPISIDDALKFTVSGGLIKPPTQRLVGQPHNNHEQNFSYDASNGKEKPE